MRSKYERKAQKELEAKGWLVDWKIRSSGRKNPKGYRVDYFGLFDLLCYRIGNSLRWISIKGHAGVPRAHKEEIRAFGLPRGNIKEIWCYTRGRTVRKEIIE